ncbi:hypothetical protein D9613_003715 [Agrocybe pediades]|uniref:Cytochrome P450 monooxygenase n=1 Tax=Agrocybe pediades TaxID=84607 RepID=A0A8H4QIM1_9AGAR|nr:hypothetical protein D9613_003715 [Agrocybe pediades]
MSVTSDNIVPGSKILVVNIFVGLITHTWFRKYEPKTILSALLPISGIICITSALASPHIQKWSVAVLLSSIVFIATLLGSIVAYRLSFFHPLAKYPGPILCRITKLWGAWIAWNGKPHIYYKQLHDKYGPIVRIGPNELSVIDTNLIHSIFGMPKGPMWDGRRILPSKNFNKQNSLTSVRDLRRHAELRKPWNNAFKPSAIASYEEMLRVHAEQFIQKLSELCQSKSGSIDLAMWINYFTFDFMGDVAFGGVYSLMRDGDKDEALLKMRRGVFLPSVTQNIPWILSSITSLPFIAEDTLAFGRFGIEQAKKRAALVDSLQRKDLCYYLLEDSKIPVLSKLTSSALLAIVAGSDTTAAVLSNIFYYLIRDPRYFKCLQEEIDSFFPKHDAIEMIDVNALTDLPFLNAVINETLRLQPPVPTSLQRAPAFGSGGKALSSDMYIPEGTAVLVSPYIMQRAANHFSPDPDTFWPERWLSAENIKTDQDTHSRDNFIFNSAAFIPFSSGPANCPGKPLAMIELRYLTCLLVRTFDFDFADGYDHRNWEKDLVDRFVMLKGELPVTMKRRKLNMEGS